MTLQLQQYEFPSSPEFSERIKQFKKEWSETIHQIGEEETPKYDGNGKKIIKLKGTTGYNYIEETYMRDCLDRHFPGWSWEMAAPLHFLGSEWVVAQGHLVIIDEHLIPFGIVPPVRRFYGVDSVRIQYSKDMPHVPENIIDVGDNCKQVNTSAMKYAINRLTRIGDDVYGKRVEFEGAGDLIDIFKANPTLANFTAVANQAGVMVSSIWKLAGTNNLNDVKDYLALWDKVVEYRKNGGK